MRIPGGSSHHGLSASIAWSTESQGPAHALEGNITVSAQAAAWAAAFIGLVDAAALSDLAQSVEGSEGVTFVPALAGLGAPHWNNKARGTITGLSLATTRAHLARATLEAVALQVADVFTAMEQDVGHRLDGLRADGGALANDFLMQLQANFLDRPVMRGEGAEVGALGVASMAFEAIGVPMAYDIAFQPQIDPERRDEVHEGWHRALAQVLSNETTFQASRGLGLGI